ncbi:MAG: hypothetical protein ACJ76N_05910 [Thermoanaerobaculia bacterium]
MYDLKPLSREAIPAALEKAHRYRLLNEPLEAESICRDILAADPGNQEAAVTLLLALTDQFEDHPNPCLEQARQVLAQIRDEYSRTYHAGIICERRAKAQLKRGGAHAGYIAHDWLKEAMEHFEKAAALRPPGNDDAILRWNTCARALMANPRLVPAPEETSYSWQE